MWQTKTCKHTNTSTFLKEQQINHIQMYYQTMKLKSEEIHENLKWDINIPYESIFVLMEKNNKHAWWKNVLVKCTRNVLIKF